MEASIKSRRQDLKENEIAVKKQDIRIVQLDKAQHHQMMNLDGNIVDKKAAIIMETQQAIEMIEQRVEAQQHQLDALNKEH